MALRFSTGLRDARLENQATVQEQVTALTISFGDGDGSASRDTINDSGSGLGNFEVYDKLTVSGSTSNDGTYEILSVTAGTIEIAAGSLTAEVAGDQVVLASARGGSLKDLLRNGVLDIYSGTQPTTADDTESGTKLVRITESSGTFVADADDNGLNLGASVSGVIGKRSGETWSGLGLVNGTAGWFRFYANDATTGASTTAVRLDGSIATTGAQMNMSNTTITASGTTTIGTVAITDPMS